MIRHPRHRLQHHWLGIFRLETDLPRIAGALRAVRGRRINPAEIDQAVGDAGLAADAGIDFLADAALSLCRREHQVEFRRDDLDRFLVAFAHGLEAAFDLFLDFAPQLDLVHAVVGDLGFAVAADRWRESDQRFGLPDDLPAGFNRRRGELLRRIGDVLLLLAVCGGSVARRRVATAGASARIIDAAGMAGIDTERIAWRGAGVDLDLGAFVERVVAGFTSFAGIDCDDRFAARQRQG